MIIRSACVVLLVSCVYAEIEGFGAHSAARSLYQADVDAGVWIANFTGFPPKFGNDSTSYNMSETQLQSTVSVTAQDGPQYGVYPLGPLQVEQLELAVTTEMVRFNHWLQC